MQRLARFIGCLILTLSFGYSWAQPFWIEEFSAPQIPLGWSTSDESSNSNPGLWQICTVAADCPPDTYSNFGSFLANTASTGYIFMDSGALGDDLPSPHISKLISPPIDCSEHTEVFIQFKTFIGTFNLPAFENAVLRVQTPTNNQLFFPFPCLTIGSEEFSENPSNLIFDLSAIAAGESEVTLSWEWTGNFEFFWCLDDIQLWNIHPKLGEGAIWYEDFSKGDEAWIKAPIGQTDELWEWQIGGDVGNGALARTGTRILGASGCDGAMVFNADFYTTEGNIQNVFPPYEIYISELISPPIDLSAVPKSVALEFSQLVRILNPAQEAPSTAEGRPLITSFSISTDDGQTWSSPIDANPELNPATSTNSVPPLNSRPYFPLPNTHGNEAVRLKFTWAGDFYYWVLDDLAIIPRPAYDVQVNRNFFGIVPNAMTPVSQTEEIRFLADVSNIGAEIATGVHLDLIIQDTANNQIIYQDQLDFGTLEVDSIAENQLFSQRLLPSDLQQKGVFEGQYEIELDSLDQFPDNNTIKWSFQITDTTFAKETGATRNIAPSSTLSYRYGNCFFVPNGEGWYARYVTFAIANADQLINETLNTYLFKWDGDLNNDNQANPEELGEPIGLNSYTLRGLESSQLLTIPIDFQGAGIGLEDSTYYLVVVEYQANRNIPCVMMASEAYDYRASWFVSDSLNKPRYASVLDLNNSGTFDLFGFGLDVVPVVRLHIGTSPDLRDIAVSSTNVNDRNNIKLWPNPARNQLYLELSPEFTQHIDHIQIINQWGQPIQIDKSSLNQPINTSGWSSGTYWLTIGTKTKTLSKRFLVLP